MQATIHNILLSDSCSNMRNEFINHLKGLVTFIVLSLWSSEYYSFLSNTMRANIYSFCTAMGFPMSSLFNQLYHTPWSFTLCCSAFSYFCFLIPFLFQNNITSILGQECMWMCVHMCMYIHVFVHTYIYV